MLVCTVFGIRNYKLFRSKFPTEASRVFTSQTHNRVGGFARETLRQMGKLEGRRPANPTSIYVKFNPLSASVALM